jgi:hypothetical protein
MGRGFHPGAGRFFCGKIAPAGMKRQPRAFFGQVVPAGRRDLSLKARRANEQEPSWETN